MAITNSYLTSTKNLESIINSVINAKAPERFTNKFLEDLGYKSSNDRLVIGMFKALGLLDDNGQPLQRYLYIGEVGMQLAGSEQIVVQDFVVLLQVSQSALAVNADRPFFLGW